MRTVQEVEKALEELIEVKKRHTPPPPKKCSTCGQTEMRFMDTWLAWDLYFINGEIHVLEWILEKTNHLTKDHT